jgi:hypothetical protein
MTPTLNRSPSGRPYRGQMHISFRKGVATLVVGAAVLLGCQSELTLPNYNAPTVEGLSGDAAGLQLAATGILVRERANYFGYIRDVAVFGREGYYYFATDTRYVTDYLIGAGGKLSSTGFASGNWFEFFRNQRNAFNLVSAANSSSLSGAQKAAARGFANTFRALDLYYEITLRDTLGTPVEIRPNPTDQAPFVSRDSVYKSISALLDTAKADLTTAGSVAFPFTLHSGFAGFNTPASFLLFNRAIAARVFAARGSLECKNACYTQALTAVSQSFATAPGAAATVADLNKGTYNIYSSASGDQLNSLNQGVDVSYAAHASIVADAQNQADGVTPDARLTRKVAPLAAPKDPPSGKGIQATQGFIVAPAPDTPSPIIRNEELLLIRAEANIQLGNSAQALIDLNNVRAVSGNMPPLAGVPTIDQLLYERRYSLLTEGFRWADARRFGKLSTLPLDLAIHFVAKVVPIPKAECDARLVIPNGC